MVSGGASKHFRVKRGAIPKIEGGSCKKMYWFGGGTQDF